MTIIKQLYAISWCSYTNKNLNAYNVKLSLNSLYYEEESEEQTEATDNDVNKLCIFDRNFIGVLSCIIEGQERKFHGIGLGWFEHCRPLTKAEIQEFMEKAE